MNVFFFVLIVLLGAPAAASDAWDYCLSADGAYRLEFGELSVAGSAEPLVLGDLVTKINIKREKEACILKNSGQPVVSFAEDTTFETYKIISGENEFFVDFMCKRGGSGIPASDSCNEDQVMSKTDYHFKD